MSKATTAVHEKGCRGCGEWCAVPGCSVCVKCTEYCVKCERVYHETRRYPQSIDQKGA